MRHQKSDNPVQRIIRPQPGPQMAFAATPADIALYGGAAGGGKSYGLLLEPLRNQHNPRFGCVIFRRNTAMVRKQGGLWDESHKIYPLARAEPLERLEWNFPSGARVGFGHLEHSSSVYDWQGAQIPLLCFDELVHFLEHQFFYMLSRARSDSGVRGYVRATCNPDVDSWVRKLVDWWIGPDGFPIPERAGKVRWFIRIEDTLIWANTRQELLDTYGADQLPKSFTFIPSTVYDNKILLAKDPSYLANLKALPKVDRERLLGGNWNTRAAAGDYFKREWFEIIDTLPANPVRSIRYWDRASTRPSPENPDPDWTRGLLLNKYMNGVYVVVDIRSMRDSPGQVERLVSNTAGQDGDAVRTVVEQDPGAAGVAEVANYVKLLAGHDVGTNRVTKKKEIRAKPVSAQCEAGNVKIMRGAWNEDFLRELENFPLGAHDDQVDVLSGAFNEMAGGISTLDLM